MPEISVIIPTRNRHHLLGRAVSSVINQTFQEFEIIIVDNNGEENRVCDASTLQSVIDSPKVRVIWIPHAKNASQARNAGLDQAKGKWITFLDDDDVYRPEKLQFQYELANRQHASLVLCGFCFHLVGRKRIVQSRCERYAIEDWIGKIITGTPSFFHKSCDAVRFDPDLFALEDFVYFADLLEHFRPKCIPNVPMPLIDVFPQSGDRVNVNQEAIWKASRKIFYRMMKSGQKSAASHFAIRAWITNQKFKTPSWSQFLGYCWLYLKRYGFGHIRFVLQAILYRFRPLRRFLTQ